MAVEELDESLTSVAARADNSDFGGPVAGFVLDAERRVGVRRCRF